MEISSSNDYWLPADEREMRRLVQQSDFLRAPAEHLLDRIGVGPGWKSLDLACGPLGILDLLAERAGAANVTGLDDDPRYPEAAKRILTERGVSGVRLLQVDAATTGLPPDAFDLVHMRLLLTNLPNPRLVVDEALRLGPVSQVDLDVSRSTSWVVGI